MPFSSWSPSCVLRSRCGSTSFLGRFLPELRLSPLTDAKMWTNVPAEGDSISRILGMVNIGFRFYLLSDQFLVGKTLTYDLRDCQVESVCIVHVLAVVIAKALFVDVAEQVEGFNAHVCSLQAA